MKKISIIATALVMLFATSAFAAAPTTVDVKVKKVFTKDFTGAAAVTWTENNDFYFADFQLNGKTMKAAYNANGELVGTSETIAESRLPVAIASELAKNYKGYEVAGTITEIKFDGKTNYYFSVENDKRVLELKCAADGTVDIESKTIK